MTTDLPTHLRERVCGCRSYRSTVKGCETWTYDYCIRELRMSGAAARLAMVFFSTRIRILSA